MYTSEKERLWDEGLKLPLVAVCACTIIFNLIIIYPVSMLQFPVRVHDWLEFKAELD